MVTTTFVDHAAEAIRFFRIRASLTQQELADRVGMHRMQVSKHERGEVAPGKRALRAYAEAFRMPLGTLQMFCRQGIDEAAIVAQELPAPAPESQPQSTIPIFEGLPASPPEFVGAARFAGQADAHAPRVILDATGITDPAAYLCRVKGNSMSPTYNDGDMVIVSPGDVHQRGVQSGRAYAVWLSTHKDECGTLKRVIVRPGKEWELRADNAENGPIVVDSNDITAMHLVVGRIQVDIGHSPMVQVQQEKKEPTIPGAIRSTEDAKKALEQVKKRKGK